MRDLTPLCLAVLCAIFPIAGCGASSTNQPPTSPINITLTPGTTNLLVRTSTTFSATVTGHTNTSVNYSVVQGAAGGAILTNGQYTAPATPGSYTVRATSIADPSRFAEATVDVHDYRNNIALLPSRPDGYDYHTASLLPDGSVLIVGGQGNVERVHKQALRYLPASRSFETDASLNSARMAHASIALPNGKILVSGGYNPYSGAGSFDPAFSSSEIYDPANRTFSPGPDMNFPRRNHVATALKDGRVLVTGGDSTCRDRIWRNSQHGNLRSGPEQVHHRCAHE